MAEFDYTKFECTRCGIDNPCFFEAKTEDGRPTACPYGTAVTSCWNQLETKAKEI